MSDFLIFAGTSDGRKLAEDLLARGFSLVLSVATTYAVDLQPEAESLRVIQGRLSREGMEELIRAEAPLAIIDATHPYAKVVSSELKVAAEATKCPYWRLLRETTEIPSGAIVVDSPEAASEELKQLRGRILLTTGSKNIGCYAVAGPERIFPRVLPMAESLDACREAGIPEDNIIAKQGPFSYEENLQDIDRHEIAILVTKDGGKTGGCPEKLAAAETRGIDIVVIARPAESGYQYGEIIELAESSRRNT